eukprot:TRINITY_DN3177_c0_g1_i1.p1 TRINITY_DN3177_c0_g1~~TRINITY_DN3177_c0_g1_i1.p1  ORF type:complete len:186 (+),score=48.22 TRINITY_DN3177_c0_g1_i1:173-730(+)
MAVMPFLSAEAAAGRVKEIVFLMPCHSTPFYSHLHINIPMHILDCSPPLPLLPPPPHLQDPHFQHLTRSTLPVNIKEWQKSESDAFLENPELFVEENFNFLLRQNSRRRSITQDYAASPHTDDGGVDQAKRGPSPSHVVMFNVEEAVLLPILMWSNYRELGRFFHAHFPVDRELQSSVVVYAKEG